MSWVKMITITLFVLALTVICLTFEVWAAAFMGLLIAVSINGPANWIRSKWHMPAAVATLLSMAMVSVVLTGLGFVIGPPLVGQVNELGKELPIALEDSMDWLQERGWGRTVVRQIESFSGMTAQEINGQDQADQADQAPIDLSQDHTKNPAQAHPLATAEQADAEQADSKADNGQDTGSDDSPSIAVPIFQTLGTMLSMTAWTLTLILISFVITLFIALNPDVYRRGIFWMIPAKHEAMATKTMAHMSVALRWWMLGRLTSMLVVGLLTSLGMWIVGMPAPLALGALAGLLSFVPNLGPILAAVPGLILAVPEGPWMILSAVGVYVGAQLIESNLITPLVDQYTVATPPAVLIVAQMIMGVLAGAWGVLIATPLLVVVLVLTQQLYVREVIKKRIKVIGSDEDEASINQTEHHQASPQPLPTTP